MGQSYDQEQTGAASIVRVETEDYWLRFRVPPGLMPDRQFDERPARLRVHRVRPVYDTNDKVPTKAVVLIHGRTVPGPVVFDLQFPLPGRAVLSVQEALALAGIDTFAPSLLGYGRSTRFDEGLNDPGNASLRPYPPDTTICPYPEGCDRTLIEGINPFDQQGRMLLVNPLGGQRRAHSSNVRFARTDVWVRDIDQVIASAIKENKKIYGEGPDGNKVALVGYSLGGQHVGRTLYRDNPNEQLLYADDRLNDEDNDEALHTRDEVIDKVSRMVFLNSFFGVRVAGIGPTEEPDPFMPPTFPLLLNDRAGSDALWNLPPNVADCPGRIIPGTKERVWEQTMENETVGREWGGTVLTQPTRLNRSPTFSGYGWNTTVAGQLKTPTLVMQGLKDGVLPTGPGTGKVLYNALTSATNKVLVQVECASHALPWEGCDREDCTPPHATLKEALIEWIKRGKFKDAENGSWIVDESGVARPEP